MRLLRMHKATIHRQVEGTGAWNDRGDWEEFSGREEIPIRCCVQPTFSGAQYQKVLPEGIHQKDCREIYTHSKLRTADEYGQYNADYILFDGLEYEVFENNPWDSPTGRLTHHKALMIRRDKLEEENFPKANIGENF